MLHFGQNQFSLQGLMNPFPGQTHISQPKEPRGNQNQPQNHGKLGKERKNEANCPGCGGNQHHDVHIFRTFGVF
jgi:hypothetical protein